jgi:hypothetical protein
MDGEGRGKRGREEGGERARLSLGKKRASTGDRETQMNERNWVWARERATTVGDES